MAKHPVSLDKIKTIALVASPNLGDALVSMIIAHNLRRNGFRVTTFSNFLTALKAYFPEEDIQPFPDQTDSRNVLSNFDLLIYWFKSDYEKAFASEQWHSQVVTVNDYEPFLRTELMVNSHVKFSREILGLTHVVKENGFQAFPELKFRQHSRRVVIHPSASAASKQWLPKRFIVLAQQLKAQNYQPVFVLAPNEKDQFSWIPQHGLEYIAEPDLGFLARFLYESGWFIGNDSGIGHLASNFGIPTVTLFSRKSVKHRWRPGWAPGEAITPLISLSLGSWEKHYWKYFITVARVMRSFNKLNAAFPPSKNSFADGHRHPV